MTKKRVLIVDDSNFLRISLKKILEDLSFEVVGMAENGLMAITKYKELKPDVVLIDMIMPQMGGLDCLRLLKKVDPEVRAVMVSSVSSQETVMTCLKEGAKHYILKPFEEKLIKQVMETFLK
ncbi:MAG: response regulator [Nitrospirae bacterium]|nr:response regulator [Nitrospirota bacterium]MBI3604686.1 response regulator [Nitrospirota bacterium]